MTLPTIPDTHHVYVGADMQPLHLYTLEQMLKLRTDTVKTCAEVAHHFGKTYRDLYKGRMEPVDRHHLANPHTDGLSDGAYEVEDAIRELLI